MEQNKNQEYQYIISETPDRNRVKKTSRLGKTVAITLSALLIGGAFGAGGMAAYNRMTDGDAPVREETAEEHILFEAPGSKDSASTASVKTAASSSRKLMTASEVYEANVNSTVGITTSVSTNYFGYRTTAAAAGSGFIATPDGYIVTNSHVVEDSNSITVTLYDGTTYDAVLVGQDESSDIAVLKVEAKNLVPVTFGDSDSMKVGDDVIAIGNPLGELTFSLTKGVISALDREITFSNGTMMNLMQTDCAINSGNSGGALFNLYGEVVGITNAKYSSSGFTGEASIDNIGFAIPVNSVLNIVGSVIENGYVLKPYIGVSVSDVTEEMQNYGIPAGASIKGVETDGAADKAGIQENDIIIEANGQEITSGSDLSRIISSSAVGDRIEMKIYRQGKTLSVTVTVGEKKLDTQSQNDGDESGEPDDYSDAYGDFGGNFGDIFGGLFGNEDGGGDGENGGSIFDWFFGGESPFGGYGDSYGDGGRTYRG